MCLAFLTRHYAREIHRCYYVMAEVCSLLLYEEGTQSIHPFCSDGHLGHPIKSTLFLLLKLCCHPQIPAHKRVDRTFSKELETKAGCETHKPTITKAGAFLIAEQP